MSDKSDLIGKLRRDGNIREAYIRSKVSTNVASQIRALRRRNDLTQAQLAQLVGMKQSRISAVEYPGNQLSVETLIRLAAAFQIGMTIRFGSFSEMLNWENSFSQDDFAVINLDKDAEFQRDEEAVAPETNTVNTASPPSSLKPSSEQSVSSAQEGDPSAFLSLGNDTPYWLGTKGDVAYA